MTLKSRERVLLALSRKEPDRVPFCELAVDRGLAQKLLNWDREADVGTASRNQNPYTIEESKAISAALGLDNIGYILRAPTYAHLHVGIDGRMFVGDGMIKSEADLDIIDLPNPYDDALYRDAQAFVAKKDDYAAFFVTRIGFFQTVLGMGIGCVCWVMSI